VLCEHVLKRRAHAKVLLFEAQLLTLRRRVVGVEHAREVLRVNLLANCAGIVTCVEGVDIEGSDRPAGPQAQMIDGRAAIAGNQEIVRDGPDIVSVDPLVPHPPLVVARRTTMAAEPNAITNAAAPAFPEVLDAEPRARDLPLRTIFADHLG